MRIRVSQLFWLLALIAFLSSNKAYAHSDKSFPKPQENFSRHIEDVRAHLLMHQMPQRTDADAELNLPFERNASPEVPYRGKFMFIHGLNDSPFIWRDMADALSARGFDVRAILLPGHGTTPEAQLSMSYLRWVRAAREHMRLFRDEDTPFHIGGFSLGGVLATLLAVEAEADNEPIDGLLLFSPAYQSTRDHLLRWAGIYSKFKPWVFGGMIREDNPVKYNSIPIYATSQYYRTSRLLRKSWPAEPLDVPTLSVASTNDSVVDVNYIMKSFTRGFSGPKKLILYSNDAEPAPQPDVEYRRSAYPDQRVLNQSHQSVLVAPSNPLYGETGRIRVCNGNEWAVFSRCLFYDGVHWLGAQNTPSPDEVPVARITWNPDFQDVLNEFDAMFMN